MTTFQKTFFTLGLFLFFAAAFAFTGNVAHAETCQGTDCSITFTNPLGSVTSVEDVLGNVLNAVQGVIGALAVVFLVVSGILYMTSSGDERRIESAKKAMWASIIGLAIGVAAPSFLREIYGTLGTDAPSTVPAGQRISTIALNVLDVLLSVVGILAVIMLVIGGIMYMTAAGSERNIETAKKIVMFAIVGLVVAVVSLVIVNAIAGVV